MSPAHAFSEGPHCCCGCLPMIHRKKRDRLEAGMYDLFPIKSYGRLCPHGVWWRFRVASRVTRQAPGSVDRHGLLHPHSPGECGGKVSWKIVSDARPGIDDEPLPPFL